MVQGIRFARTKSDTGFAVSPRQAQGFASPRIGAHGRGFNFEFASSPTIDGYQEKAEIAKGSCEKAANACRDLLQIVLAEVSSPVAKLAVQGAHDSLVSSAAAFFAAADLVADTIATEAVVQEVCHTLTPYSAT